MKRDKNRRANIKRGRRAVARLQRAQERTGVTLIEMRPTDDPDVWEFDSTPWRRMVNEVTALMATGTSREDAAQFVVDKARKGARNDGDSSS